MDLITPGVRLIILLVTEEMKRFIQLLAAFFLGWIVFGTCSRILDAKACADFRAERSTCALALFHYCKTQSFPEPSSPDCHPVVIPTGTNSTPDSIRVFCRHRHLGEIGANVLTADGQVHWYEVNDFAEMMNKQNLFQYWRGH
jgi:hypothetical protein